MKLKTGDHIRVLTGKDRGKEGNIIQVFPRLNRVVVEGINIQKRHLRGQGKHKGQIVEFPAPLHLSNVALVGSLGAGRVGFKHLGGEANRKGKKVRVLRTAGKMEDVA
ncbi:MAG: 50S ribosomal protein L24 [Parcubacteria group bacterium GW2011_GWA2_56_7]|nr:MAG: 50S ribosomal protein L24 [Parcubacteria group bacterium GW2011_GWA2_56_7]